MAVERLYMGKFRKCNASSIISCLGLVVWTGSAEDDVSAVAVGVLHNGGGDVAAGLHVGAATEPAGDQDRRHDKCLVLSRNTSDYEAMLAA